MGKLGERFDVRIGLVLVTGVIQITLGVFVHKQVLEPRRLDVEKRPVTGDVLFFDHADLLV